MSHRDVLATCLGVLLPPARALAVLGAGACPSNWRLESGRETVQAGHWAVLPPPDSLATRSPSLQRSHHAGPRVLNRVHDSRGSRARPARGLSILHLIGPGH